MATTPVSPRQKHEQDQMYHAEMRAFIAQKRTLGWPIRRIATTLEVSPATVSKYMAESQQKVIDISATGVDITDLSPKPRTEDEIAAQRTGYKAKRGTGPGPHRAGSPKAPPLPPPGSSALSPIAALVVSGTVLIPDDEMEFQRSVWNLRKRLMPWDQIARKLGRTESECREAQKIRFEQLQAEELQSTDFHRKQMLEQIDDQIRAIIDKATGEDEDGNPVRVEYEAIDRMLKLMDQKAKLLGLNQPTKVDLTVRLRQLSEDYGYEYDDLKEILHDVLATWAASKGALGGR